MRYLFLLLFVLSSFASANNDSSQPDWDIYDQKLDSLKTQLHRLMVGNRCYISFQGYRIRGNIKEYISGLHTLNSEYGATTESLYKIGEVYYYLDNIDSMVYYFDSAATVYYLSLHRVYDSYIRCINDDIGDCHRGNINDKSYLRACLTQKLDQFDSLNAEYEMTGLGAYYIGVIYLELNQMDSAFLYLDSALVLCSNDMDIPGQKICSQNQFDSKIRRIRRDCSDMWFKIANTLFEESRQALNMMNKNIDADSVGTLIDLYNQGLNKAYKALEQAIAAVPMNPELHNDITDEISAVAKRRIGEYLDRVPLADFVYGSLLMRRGEYEAAKSYLERYIASRFNDSERNTRARKMVFECIQAIHNETGRWY